MSLRYNIEMMFFMIGVLFFQYFIAGFNRDMHIINHDIEILAAHGLIEITEEGRIINTLLMQRFMSGDTDHESGGDGEVDHEEGVAHETLTPEEEAELIEDVKAEFDHEIKLAVVELDEAMFVGMVSFAFPFQMIMSYIYSKLTDTRYVLRITAIFDLLITIFVAWWFVKFEEYTIADNEGFGLTVPPHPYHRFMQQLLEDIRTGEFHFDWLLAVTSFLFWMRLLLMLTLTNTFGPLLVISI